MTVREFFDTHVIGTDDWHWLDDGRIQCDVCPRACKLQEGQQGLCFVRARQRDQIVLASYGRSSGFCVDPIEKKPLNHFYPGSGVLSFGTAGCNLACKSCQNWDMSKSREVDTLSQHAMPEQLAAACVKVGAQSMAFTYNDPIIFYEYAMDCARAGRAVGVKSVAVTAGYMCEKPRERFFKQMDAVNVDLKAFTERFYWKLCGAHLDQVLDTIQYIHQETHAWMELTTLLIPDENDSDEELHAMVGWIVQHLGLDVPLHFTAFHPDWKMRDKQRTAKATLLRARQIGLAAGLRYVYVGNVMSPAETATYCPHCQELLIERSGYQVNQYHLTGNQCDHCGGEVAGHFAAGKPLDPWGNKRQVVRFE